MSDVLLVNAPVRDPRVDAHARASPPLGLASVAAVLRSDGLRVSALDLNLARSSPERDLREALSAERPWMVGFSATTETYPQAIRLARLVKGEDERTRTVVGGPHASFLPEEALATGVVDVVVRGEGEETAVELARAWGSGGDSIELIQGISFRRNGAVCNMPDRAPLGDLDLLPHPARELFPLERYAYPGNLVTARGCPARCIFCAAPALSGGRYRVRSPQSVVAEMTRLATDHGISRCTIVDDSFTVYGDRTARICELLQDLGLPLRWGCSTRAGSVSRELLAAMSQAGCEEIQFGVESGSEIVLASLGKGISLTQVRLAVEWARDAGLDVTCSFMVPHPRDTRATIRETRAVIRELLRQGVRTSVAVTTPFPGTDLWNRATEWGLEIVSTDWHDYDACTPVFSTRDLPRKDISLIVTDLLYNGP
jgi:radical SAM superfamily enzyme YgiQ (UPF0313 family)